MVERYELVKRFEDAVNHMVTLKEGCYFWWLDTDNEGNNWALVIGWQDGYEEDESDDLSDGTWHLAAKIAYQPYNSIMQCDYDIDWIMPYDKKTNEVWDTDTTVYLKDNHKATVDWLLKQYELMKQTLDCWKEEE